jgi:ArsR family transcriptional regulator
VKLKDGERQALAGMFALLGDPSRLSIILSCAESPLAVSEIAERTGLSTSLVSHHLRLLRTAQLVRVQREGRYAYYSIADEHVRHMLSDMVDHVRHSVGEPANITR